MVHRGPRYSTAFFFFSERSGSLATVLKSLLTVGADRKIRCLPPGFIAAVCFHFCRKTLRICAVELKKLLCSHSVGVGLTENHGTLDAYWLFYIFVRGPFFTFQMNIYALCVCVWCMGISTCHVIPVEVRGQLERIGSLLPLCGFQTQNMRFGSKCFYSRSRLPSPLVHFL